MAPRRRASRRQRGSLVSVWVCLLTVISGALSSAAPAPLKLALDGPLSPSHAPFLFARDQGLYQSAGLDLSIIFPGGPGSSLAALAAGTADVAVAEAVAIFASRAAGAPVSIIASLGDLHPAAVFTLPDSGVKAPKDLAGKRVAVDPLSADRLLFPRFLAPAGVRLSDLTLVPLDPAGRAAGLGGGSVDAAVGRVGDGQLGLDAAGIVWADFGFDLYGPCIAATDQGIRTKPAALRSFLKVTLQSWESCLREPDKAAPVVASTSRLRTDEIAAWLKRARQLFDTEVYRTKGMGLLDKGRLASTLAAVSQELGIKVSFPATEGWTQALRPSPPVLLRPLSEEKAAAPTPSAP